MLPRVQKILLTHGSALRLFLWPLDPIWCQRFGASDGLRTRRHLRPLLRPPAGGNRGGALTSPSLNQQRLSPRQIALRHLGVMSYFCRLKNVERGMVGLDRLSQPFGAALAPAEG